MHYRVKKLISDIDQSPTGYNLLSEQGNLLLTADLGSSSQGDPDSRQVRFARPDGTKLAKMNLPADDELTLEEIAGTDYAVVQDYAVYAIFTPRVRQDQIHVITLEAEGGNWLVMPRPDPSGSFALFGQLAEGYHAFSRIVEAELPPQVGRVLPAGDEETHHFNVELTARRWRQTSLVVLALVFLLDRFYD